jgi:diadenylate cyclase
MPALVSRHRVANDELRDALGRVAPGTPLRDGIERVIRARAGALLVLDDGPDVLAICSGGFLVDAPYSPQRLSELAKMDGAIILSSDGSRIARANVHLVPDPTVPTVETGTRHRTAERVARSLNVPVVSASDRTSAACSTGPTRRCRRSSATRPGSTTRSPT